MPIKLSDLTKKTRRTTVEFAEEKIEIEYRLHTVTPALLTELEKYDSKDSVMHQVATIVKKWDLIDDEGREIPVELAVMQGMPLDFLVEVLQTVVRDLQGWSKDEKKSSGDGSSTAS